jgi:hypothetical protein
MNTENVAGSNSFSSDDDYDCDDSDDPDEPDQDSLLSSRDTVPRGHGRPLDWRYSQGFYGDDEEQVRFCPSVSRASLTFLTSQRLDGKTSRFVPVLIKF